MLITSNVIEQSIQENPFFQNGRELGLECFMMAPEDYQDAEAVDVKYFMKFFRS